MRRLKPAAALVSMAAVLCTVAPATAAAAAEFTASRHPKQLSEAEPGKTRGVGVGSTGLGGEMRDQELQFGAYTMYCAAQASSDSISEGAVSWLTSQVFATEVKFTKCLTEVSAGGSTKNGVATRFNVSPTTGKSEPVKFVYHVNGFAQLGSEEAKSEVEVGSGATTFTIAGKLCKISWPAQIVPAKAAVKPNEAYSAAKYSTVEAPVEERQWNKFPSHRQQELVIANEFKNMAWSYEEGQCVGEGGFEKPAPHEEAKTGVYNGKLQERIIGGDLGFN